MSEKLLTLAAEIARGDYHPSHCVEDYRKGTGRETFAQMAGECADRLRAKVSIIKDAHDRIATLEGQVEQWMEHGNTMQKAGHEMMKERDRFASRVSYYEETLCFPGEMIALYECPEVRTGVIQTAKVGDVVKERDRLRGDLVLYGQHQPGCLWHERNHVDECDCGWDEARKTQEALAPEKET